MPWDLPDRPRDEDLTERRKRSRRLFNSLLGRRVNDLGKWRKDRRADERWLVLDALGEVYAVRNSAAEAMDAIFDANSYLHDAATCGHPDASAWVTRRLPLRASKVDVDDLDDLLGGETPILDREGG